MTAVIVEIRSGEGGDHSKLLIYQFLKAYYSAATRSGL